MDAGADVPATYTCEINRKVRAVLLFAVCLLTHERDRPRAVTAQSQRSHWPANCGTLRSCSLTQLQWKRTLSPSSGRCGLCPAGVRAAWHVGSPLLRASARSCLTRDRSRGTSARRQSPGRSSQATSKAATVFRGPKCFPLVPTLSFSSSVQYSFTARRLQPRFMLRATSQLPPRTLRGAAGITAGAADSCSGSARCRFYVQRRGRASKYHASCESADNLALAEFCRGLTFVAQPLVHSARRCSTL